jgi:two-component system chemotaxis sensor kinase CheA
MRWLLSLWAAWTGSGTESEGPAGEPGSQPGAESGPAQRDSMHDVGIEITFAPHTTFRSITANAIYTALFQLGDVVWFFPNFVIAEDSDLERFTLTIRTAAPWEQLASAIFAAVSEPTDLQEVRQVAPQYADPVPECQTEPVAAELSDQPAAPGAPTELAEVQSHSIRVDLHRLDTLSNLIGELVVEKAELADLVARLEGVCTEGYSRTLVQELRQAVGKLNSTSSQLQEQATELRMVPVGQLFGRFKRLVRDLSAATGKRLILRREGEETMLDKAIVEEMVDPLLHLIRNAADHGIEGPAERMRSRKPEAGRITLRAYDQGDHVVIEVEDDGKGIDAARVKAKALERGLITPETAAALSEAEVLRLIFLPGFSTADQVTDISGRGVGMDVVKVNVERLRGTLDVKTFPGKGTRFIIRLPLTVSVMRVMLAEAAGQVVAVPLTALHGLVRLTDASRVLWDQAIDHAGSLLPLVDLGALWRRTATGGQYALVMNAGNQEIALLVNRPLGQGEVVIKPLGDYVGRLPGVAGAAILADGRIALILDGSTLIPDEHCLEGGVTVDFASAH